MPWNDNANPGPWGAPPPGDDPAVDRRSGHDRKSVPLHDSRVEGSAREDALPAGGGNEAEVNRRQIGKAELGERRHIGKEGRAGVGIHGQRFDRAAADMRDEVGQTDDRHGRRSGQKAGDDIAAAARGNADEVGAGLLG